MGVLRRSLLKEQRGSSAAGLFADLDAPQADPTPNEWESKYISSCAQGCDDIDDQLSYNTLLCKLRSSKNDVRMNYCHAC